MATDLQIAANRKNAERSTGPRTDEGKAASRANALKHGLTGSGVVLSEADAAEVDRLSTAFRDELKPPGEAGDVLVRRMAVLAVRMDHCVSQEAAALTERVQQALDDFETPEGTSPEEADKLRTLAGRRALFDPSKEAAQARRYEAAAERGFFKALKELRQLQKEATAPDAAISAAAASRQQVQKSMAQMGSFLQADATSQPRPAPATPTSAKPRPIGSPTASRGSDSFVSPHFDVPITIGRAR